MAVHAPLLSNEIVTLEPLTPEHAAPLAECVADDPNTFRYFARGIEPGSEASMRHHVMALLATDTVRAYAVRRNATGDLVGSTTLLDIREAHLGVEIGWTFYGPAARGTAINPACKLLLMEHAFSGGVFGEPAIRVQFTADERNARSRRAIEKLGAVFEGIKRSDRIMADGFRRSSAVYSVLLGEWPGVREALLQRVR